MMWTSDKTLDVVLYALVSYTLGHILSCFGLMSFWTVFIVTWILSAGTCLYLASLEISPGKKAVIVTGCDSGFGHEIALKLDKLGFRVFAGCLLADAGGEGAKDLRKKGSERLHVLQMDVTSSEQLDKALEVVEKLLPDDEVLWGIVNNAGIAYMGAVEWVPLKDFKTSTEVNYLGLVAATKTFLPLIRRSKGRVVNISSLVGGLAVLWFSPYIGTKYAVEGFSDCLRLEMRKFGVKVSLIEPSSYIAATQLLTKEMLTRQADSCWEGLSEEIRSAYGEETFRQSFEGYMNHGERNIQPVVDAVTEALTQMHPRARYCPSTWPFKRMLLVARHLPEWVYDAIF
ncbi:D-beta-hydroxybutyrate dehydrogenase, mitochondrial-like [Penaeus japonicus]|uniref:D-beta-hydroxybutyrate dehydrogenase, mitochondrial-like n=1 Tax=Penaeus japonicus TaxID=27405 RepID=UPI001C70BF22|nr:D-beta-hydroxybutyrate dehydrogenase, mitochondrial-like [Penaeus japonicus]